MSLDHFQKNYIKKNIRNSSVEEISVYLKIPKEEVINYLKKRWGEEKLNKYLGIYTSNQLPEEKKTSLKLFLRDNWANLLLLTILGFGVYLNALGNDFLSDDLAEIVNNPNIGNLANAISTHPYGFIRPIIYWFTFQLAGLNPIAFRLGNILLHLGSIYLVFALVSYLHSKKAALFATAIFAVHPLLVESVIWVSGGGYPQYSFFFLLSFLFYILSGKKLTFYILSIVFYLFSLMSHLHMPLSLVLVYPLYELIFGNLKTHWKKIIPFALICLTYATISLVSLPAREQTLTSVHYQERGVDNVLILVPVAISSYLNLIFWPQDLTLYHSELAFGQLKFALIAIEFLVFLALWVFSFKTNKKVFFWLSFFMITLLPSLTPFRLNWIVAERYVYLGSIGIFASVALVVEKLLQKNKMPALLYILLILLIVPLSIRTILRNIDWKNQDNLWIATGKTSPSSPNTHNNLGDMYGRHGDKQKALQEFQTAIALKPNYGDAYHNLANTYHELGQDDKALENYQKAAQFNPGLWQSYQNIAAIYFAQKKYDLAIEYLQKGIQVNPNNINLRNNLGIVYLITKQKDKAKEIFTLVLTADPKNQAASMGLLEANK
ncbi:tetratricopeptide repeat protein [Candidatus Daviesbacteria bacterium]|nr:tetratricopeptide repeat protein [Candidatus Daviesbacteria bacterium]